MKQHYSQGRLSDHAKLSDAHCELESAKASIDHTDMLRQCNEELPKVPFDNLSRIEEPLVYKTMHHCVESSS